VLVSDWVAAASRLFAHAIRAFPTTSAGRCSRASGRFFPLVNWLPTATPELCKAVRPPLSHATCRRAAIDRSHLVNRFQLTLFWSTNSKL
jgi:hypothetical protein